LISKDQLEKLYNKYSHKKYVYPDPVGFLYNYEHPEDREIAGLIASSLAYGRVAQIHKSVSAILDKMNTSPSSYIQKKTKTRLFEDFKGFKHRFTTDYELSLLLCSIKDIYQSCGSLQQFFLKGLKDDDETIIPAVCQFSQGLIENSKNFKNSLMPCPSKGSACKRLNLYLRWMVRNDNIDPGGWDQVPASKLIMPVDTHIYRFAIATRMTGRKNADMKTALEITAGFKKYSPEDPVKYDFAITRGSILNEKVIIEILKNIKQN
jgi:uncharacterized protein (TIGR02757 family)